MTNGIELAIQAQKVEERYLHEHIAILQRSYEAAAKPYIDRLVSIRSMRLGPIAVPRDYFAAIESLKEPTP